MVFRFREEENAADDSESKESSVQPPKTSPSEVLSHGARDDWANLQTQISTRISTWAEVLTMRDPKYTAKYSVLCFPRSCRKITSAMMVGWIVSAGPAPIPFNLMVQVSHTAGFIARAFRVLTRKHP